MPAPSLRQRFDNYLAELHDALGDRRRHEHFDAYCQGLNLSLERKSVEPIAAAIDPENVSARHQSLLHFVAEAPWSDRALLDRVAALVQRAMGDQAQRYWLVDDTAHPKKGRHSVGVGRQYCGAVGKIENCQVMVSLSVATSEASVPIDHRLYLPKSWTEEPERRAAAGVPEDVAFATKAEIALGQIGAAIERGVSPGTLVADAGYGDVTAFRDRLDSLGLVYSVGVKRATSVVVCAPEGRAAEAKSMTVKGLAEELSAQRWRTVRWRIGTNGPLSGRFARVRVRAAHGGVKRAARRPEQWLVIEWAAGAEEPSGYFLSNEPASATLAELVTTIKSRWRVERDYQEMKSEFGLGHYEGRGWRGFHHHASLSIATYAFSVLERLSGRGGKKGAARAAAPVLPEGFQPRGTPRRADAASRA